ncbi:YciI family protein [Microcella daejeonensis]|uniref:YciI family protein n=1 Tax=Microcella daejeonensis TaxID=2994971 RepID=UPI00226EE4C1|nr:YciI family protein [Microcella daejeonensis]WAB84425.1 YciI family protein [Microcella daejeonensis]
MKYVIMFTTTPELDAEVPSEHAEQVYRRTYDWFGTHREVMTESGAQLKPVSTATTVRHGGDGPVVADGPFSEAKEAIGGFQVIDVPDLDAAIAVVKTWPLLELPGVAVEIRPIIVY